MLDLEMAAGYQAMATENRLLAERAIVVDNETWPVQ
jgi:hypothetical protein